MYKRIILYPDLSHALGNDDGKAEILQQVYYWTSLYSKNPEKYKNHFQDSAWWVYNSYSAWKENDFPNMSVKSIERKFVALREQGYLIRATRNYNKIKFGKGKAQGENINDVSWYRINFEKLHAEIPMTKEIFPNINGQSDVTSTDNLSVGYGQSDVTSTDNLSVGYGQSDVTNTLKYPYTSTENKTNTSPYTENSDSDEWIIEVARGYLANRNDIDEKERILPFISLYLQTFRTRRGEEHGRVSVKTIRKAVDNLIETRAYKKPEVINKYFTCTEFSDSCDFRIAHFTSLKVLRKRLEEVEQEEKARERKEKELFSNGSEDEEPEMTDEEWLAMMDDSNEQTRQEQEEPHNTEQTFDNPTCTERKREPTYSVMDNNEDLNIPIENDEILPFL